jgi:hypothetical protein
MTEKKNNIDLALEWHNLKYLGPKIEPFDLKLDYCDEVISFNTMYNDEKDKEWISDTMEKITSKEKYWIIVRVGVFISDIKLGSSILGGLLFDNILQLENMMKNDNEAIIAEAIKSARHNLESLGKHAWMMKWYAHTPSSENIKKNKINSSKQFRDKEIRLGYEIQRVNDKNCKNYFERIKSY